MPGLEALTGRQPYRERGWALLVLALYRTGRQADALAALRRVGARLDDELGLRPGPELRDLEQAVLAHAPELRLPGPPRPGPAPAPPAARARPVDGLVARDAELALADRWLAAARRGGGVLVVSGEAGIGKTRYAGEVADRAAARGFTVARGGCVDGTAPAFWPWVQVLREAAGEPAGALLTDEVPAADPDAALYARYERVVAALATAPGPLLIVLEDLQWADVSSLRLLSHVAGALARRPVLVVATLRPEPGDHPGPLRDTLGAPARLEGTGRVELKPFTGADMAAYLRARGSGEELAQALLDRTGGNPFYLGEVLRLWESEGRAGTVLPAGVRDVVARRVARLPEETARLLRTAAVAGTDVAAELLAAVTGLPVAEVLDGLEPAVATDTLVAAATEPDMAPLRPIAILATAESGRPDRAHELLTRWGTTLPDDWTADFLLPVWGLIAAHLGTPDPEHLYARLAPYAGQLVIAGMGTAGWGSTHAVLAALATRLDRPDLAARHGEAARETHRRLGLAPPTPPRPNDGSVPA